MRQLPCHIAFLMTNQNVTDSAGSSRLETTGETVVMPRHVRHLSTQLYDSINYTSVVT